MLSGSGRELATRTQAPVFTCSPSGRRRQPGMGRWRFRETIADAGNHFIRARPADEMLEAVADDLNRETKTVRARTTSIARPRNRRKRLATTSNR